MKGFPSARGVRNGDVFGSSGLKSIDPLKILHPVKKWVEDVDCKCSQTMVLGEAWSACQEALPEATEKRRASLGLQPNKKRNKPKKCVPSSAR